MAKVLVFLDNPGAELKKSSLELLTLARSLGESAVAVNGEVSDAAAATLAEYGVSTVVRPSAQDLNDYLSLPRLPTSPPPLRQQLPASSSWTTHPRARRLPPAWGSA
jgi:electron transfer flavoprotein alpha subunit